MTIWDLLCHRTEFRQKDWNYTDSNKLKNNIFITTITLFFIAMSTNHEH